MVDKTTESKLGGRVNNHHQNARTTFYSRTLGVKRVLKEGKSVREVAEALGVSRRTAYKWLTRYRDGGPASLYDRSSRPLRSPRRLPVGRVATIKLGKIDGEGHRIHGDRSKRKRGIGWEYLHVCVDDHSRLSYTELLGDEKTTTATCFLISSTAWFKRHGVTARRVMTDNGSCYRSHLFRSAVQSLGARQVRTRPYTPRTNSKAERSKIQAKSCK